LFHEIERANNENYGSEYNYMNISFTAKELFIFIIIIIIIIIIFTAIELLPGGSDYFTCKQNTKLVTTKFKSGGLHEKHVVAAWNLAF